MLLLEKRINKMHTSFIVPTHQLTADKLKDMRKVQIALTRNPQRLLANHKLKTDRNSLSLTVSSGKIGVASLSFITRKQKKGPSLQLLCSSQQDTSLCSKDTHLKQLAFTKHTQAGQTSLEARDNKRMSVRMYITFKRQEFETVKKRLGLGHELEAQNFRGLPNSVVLLFFWYRMLLIHCHSQAAVLVTFTQKLERLRTLNFY